MQQYSMIKGQQTTMRWLGMLTMLLVIVGCDQGTSFPGEGRPGSTVFVALDEAQGSGVIRPNEVTATYVDNNAVSYDVTVRNVIRFYPDPVSDFGAGSYSKFLDACGVAVWERNHYRGQWVAIVDLIDPATTLPPASPSLPMGNGVIKLFDGSQNQIGQNHPLEITSTVATTPEDFAAEGNDVLDFLEPQPYLIVETQGIDVLRTGGSTATIAGATLTLRYDGNNLNNAALRIAKLSNDPFLQVVTSEESLTSPAGWKELTVVMSNPNGFRELDAALNAPDLGYQSLERDLSSLVVTWQRINESTTVSDANFTTYFTLVSGSYYDTEGNELAELSAQMVPVL